MSVTTFATRLLGGHDLGVSYDSVAGTITILGQSISVSSLSSALQAQWAAAVANAGTGYLGSRGAFGGDAIGQVVGNILDSQGTWRAAVQTALTAYLGAQTTAAGGGSFAGVETFNR